jgi:5-methylcytosine-specific restriction endonuclease McrA
VTPRPPPSAEQQLEFLAKLQRLFAEGDFTATYKFALLISLADLAVELGQDNGDPLRLTLRQIANRFVDLYWQQAVPYSRPGAAQPPLVLQQNPGNQAAIVTAIVEFRCRTGCSTLTAARRSSEFPDLIGAVSGTVSAQPLTYLQNVGGSELRFLYEREHGAVVLLPGVMYCLRRFQPLVQQLARSHWVGHVKRNAANRLVLAESGDLEAFLFEMPRQSLELVAQGLRKLSNHHCFYCGTKVQDAADIDHFVPFSMYPADRIHNFVLAHPACNRSKSDTLAARPHLERWLEFVSRSDDALREIGELAGRVGDSLGARAIAHWGYANALHSGGQAWVRSNAYEQIDSTYLACFP